jgi:peptide/nickel transport system substrate-binding protein
MGFLQREAKESGYNNPQVDKLINEGNAVLDVEKRKPIYHQLYQVLAHDPPVILLGYRKFSPPAAPASPALNRISTTA